MRTFARYSSLELATDLAWTNPVSKMYEDIVKIITHAARIVTTYFGPPNKHPALRPVSAGARATAGLRPASRHPNISA